MKAVILSYLADGMYEADLGADSANNAQSFAYNDGAKVTTVTDPNGIVSEYGHDSFGNVTSFRDDVNGKNVQTTFEYDNRFNLTKMSDANGEHRYLYDQYGNLLNKVDPDGGTTVNAYDKNNNLIRSTEPFGYTANLLLDSNFEISKDGTTDYNRQTGWWGRWWLKTGTDFDSMNLAAASAVDTVHPSVNFTDYNPGGQADYYNTHLEGYIIPASSESYKLYVTADDGVRLWFDGVLAVDCWQPQYASTYSWTTPNLEAGKSYPVVIEHYERQGAERLTLEWESASQTREVIPQSQVVNKYTNFTRASNAYTDESPLVGSGNPRFVGNLAYGKSVSLSPETTVQPYTTLTSITNGDLSSAHYGGLQPIGQPVYVQVDLGSLQNVSQVKVWHYYADGRTYHNTKTQVSADGTNWATVFDSAVSGEYPETAGGKTHTLSPAMNIRYIRDYVNSNSLDTGNHWVEIQAFNAFGQALLLEEGTTNKIGTEGGGATTDWTKWGHWSNRTYWSSESQSYDPTLGNVYTGVNARNEGPYLFDYYPDYSYAITANQTYTISMLLKLSQPWSGTVKAYINQGSDNLELANGVQAKTLNLTTAWQKVSFTITPTQNPVGGGGFGILLAGLPAGITVYAARPQFEQKAFATTYTESTRSKDSLKISTAGILSLNEGTIETRVYVSPGLRDQTEWRYVFASAVNEQAPWNNTIGLRHAGTGYNAWMFLTIDQNGQAMDVTVPDDLTEGWHSFAVRWTKAVNALFIDGVKRASIVNPLLPSQLAPDLYIGSWINNDSGYINTSIDDFRISSRALTDQEILEGYQSGQPLPIDADTTYKLNFEGDLSLNKWGLTSWSPVHENGSLAAIGIDPQTAYYGDQSLKLEKLNSTSRSYLMQKVSLTPDQTYTLSAWVNTNTASGSGSQGATLLIRYQDAVGNWVEENSEFLTGTRDWQRISYTFTLPAAALTGEVQIGLALAGVTGSAWFDAIQLEEGTAPTSYNLLNNNSFESGSNGQIPGWTPSAGAGLETRSVNIKEGSRSLKITHDLKGDWRGATSERIPVKPGDVLTLSAYVKAANFIPNGNQDLLVRFFADDNATLIGQDGPIISAGSYDWVRIAKTITIPVGVSFIDLSIRIKPRELATIWIDALELQFGNVSTGYTYDPNNNRTEEVNEQGDAVSYQYDWYGNLTAQSLALSTNENFISNSSFENVGGNNLPVNWQLTSALPAGVSAQVESGQMASFSRSSAAYGENGATLNNDVPRFTGDYTNTFGQALLLEEGTTNLLSNGGFENISNTVTSFSSDMKSSASWTPLSGSFTFSSNGAASQVFLSELKTGNKVWKPIVGTNGQPVYLEAASTFTTPASVPKAMEVKLYQDPNNWYQAIWQGDNNFVIYKSNSNGRTTLGWNATAVTQTANTSYKIGLRLDPNGSLTGYIANGATNQVLSSLTFTDTSLYGPFDFVVGADVGVLVTKSYVYAPLPDGFNDSWPAYNGGFSSTSLSGGKYGSRALRMDRHDQSSPTYDYLYRQQVVNVSANTTYTLSADYMLTMTSTITDAPRSAGFVVYFYDASWNMTGNPAVNWGWPAMSNWSRRSFTFSTPANTSRIAVELRMSTLGTLYWDGLQLEQKSFATSYTESTRSEEVLTVPASVLNSSEGTVETRVYVNSNTRNLAWNRYIFAYSPSSASYANTLAFRHTSSNRWSVWTTNSANVNSYADVANTLAEGWHSFAVRWNASELALFIDGQKQASVSNPNLPTISPSGRLYLGKWPYTGMQSPNTLIDDFRISSRALTDQEILAGYQSGQALPAAADTTYKLSLDSNLLPEGKYFGRNTLKVSVPQSVAAGSYGLTSDAVTAIPNGTYTLSGYLKGQGIQDGSGAWLMASFYDSQDNFISETGAQPFSGTFDWKRQIITFETPKETAKVKISLILNGHGTAWFDGILLERGASVTRYHLVENSGLERGTKTPDAWSFDLFAGQSTQDWSGDYSKDGARSIRIISTNGADASWNQKVRVKPSTTYTFTGWVKTANLQPLDALVFGTYFIKEYNQQGTAVQDHRNLGNTSGSTDWKRITYTFTTKPETVELWLGASLGNWGQASGAVWFDGIRLYEGDLTQDYSYDWQNNFPIHSVDPLGNSTSATYDLVGNKLTQTDALGHTTTYAYDRFNRLVKVTDALGSTTTFTYNVNGNKTSETDPLGHTTTYAYDAFDRLVRITEPDGSFSTTTYDAAGNKVRSIDPLGNVYSYQYDGLNKLVAQIDPTGGVTRSGYDLSGNLTTLTNPLDYVTSYDYDSLNRLTRITDPLGHTVSYAYDQKGKVTAKAAANGNTTNYVYDYSGKLIRQIDPLGNTSFYTYDEAGRIVLKVDPNGSRTQYLYDNLGRLIEETDALAGSRHYTYDAKGNLTTVTDQNGNTTTMAYDDLNRLLSTQDALGYSVSSAYDPNGNIRTFTDALGNVTTYTYDNRDRLISVQDPLGYIITYAYDANNNRVAVTDGRGNTTQYLYDPLNRLLQVTDALGGVTSYTYDGAGNPVTATDPNGNTTTMTYDEANRLMQVRDPLGNFRSFNYDPNGNLLNETTPNGGIIAYTYNANNWLTSVTNPLNQTESYTYDSVGNQLTVTDKRGNATYYVYDALNRLIQVSTEVTTAGGPAAVRTSYTYDAVGNRLSATDPKGYLTRYAYDMLNRLLSVTDPLGGASAYTYDGSGNQTSVTDPMDHTTQYAYDKLGRLETVTDPLNGVTSFTYDENSNRLSVTDANGYTTTYTYDELNRVKTVLDPEGGLTGFSYAPNGNTLTVTDGNNNTTTFTYTQLNQVATETSALGAITRYTYDASGNRLTVTDSNNRVTTSTYTLNNQVGSVKDPLNNTISYTYDENGNLLTVTDALFKVTRYAYDELNRVTSVTDPLNNVTTYEYDLNSNRTAVTDAEGGKTTYAYDALNRLTGVTNQIGDTKSYAYDQNGNVIQFTDGNNAVTTYEYDALNRLKTVTYPNSTQVSYTYDQTGNRLSMTDSSGTTAYTYDKLNRLKTETNPEQKVNSYAYDKVGNIIQKIIDGVTQTFGYDGENRLKSVTRSGYLIATYNYDLAGNLTQESNRTGVSTNYVYDAANRVKQMKTTDGSGQVLSNITFTYDALGRKLTETNQLSGETITYHYDDGGRLDGVTTPGGQTTYGYDKNGNLLTKTDAFGTTSYVYNKANQLIRMSNSASGQVVTFEYDKNVNQTKRIDGTNTTVYTFNSAGKLTSITNPDGSTIAYIYDGDGRRVSETVGGVITKFYYDGLLVAKETDENGVTKAEYLYGLGGRPIRMTSDGVTYYYVFNAHGDTIALVDSTGAVKASYSYDPWGEVTVNSGSTIKNPFLYAGQFGIYHDAATGLDLMQTRYYNSSINRFISPDEFPGIVAKPISHNGYIYVHDDPINNVDPDGHAPKWLTNAWNSVKSAASWVGTKVEQTATWTVTKVEQAASWAATKLQQAASWVSKKVSRTIDRVKSTARSVATRTKTAVQRALESARLAAAQAAQKAKEAARIAQEQFEKTKEEARESLDRKSEEIRQRVAELAESAKMGLIQVGDGITSFIESKPGQMVMSGLQVAGGVTMTLVGGAIAVGTGWTGSGAVVGAAIMVHGINDIFAGGANLYYAGTDQTENIGSVNPLMDAVYRPLFGQNADTAYMVAGIGLGFTGGALSATGRLATAVPKAVQATRAVGNAERAVAQGAGKAEAVISASGNPQSIMLEGASLNSRQSALLSQLDGFGSQAIVPKKMVSMKDISALSAYTGDEFAMFTTGGRRLIVRGANNMVPINESYASKLANAGWRWSAHTHPGISQTVLGESSGDIAILRQFSGQGQSQILNSLGQSRIFSRDMSNWLP